MHSCSTKTWNVIPFNLTKGVGLVVDAQFAVLCSHVAWNVIQFKLIKQTGSTR